MTSFVYLNPTTEVMSLPPFLQESPDPEDRIRQAVSAVSNARNIVVVCGAGISVGAGIPDFRSRNGIFSTTAKELGSGKRLFESSVFRSTALTSKFCRAMASLSSLCDVAEPTAFHHLLRTIDKNGHLLRVYTQNVDTLEEKAGLSFGTLGIPVSKSCHLSTANRSLTRSTIGRCVPLHGTLQQMRCDLCAHLYPIREHIESLAMGVRPHCPNCVSIAEVRRSNQQRPRAIGLLQPAIVLYDETHQEGDVIAEIVAQDLPLGVSSDLERCSGADLLLVVGTSLQVPGTKRLVRQFSKALRSRSTDSDGMSQPCESPPLHSIFLNLGFPTPPSEWKGVFDIWIQGDVQDFA
ncbi:DHS-like NAD/FAD-binding domain-containing protein, partial [Daedaleopsis nitida]